MADFDSGKPVLDPVNDMQFNASMDALLESENFDSSGSSDSIHPNGSLQANGAVASSGAEGPRQGLLTTPAALGATDERMVYSLPQVPYAVAATNAAPLPSGMQRFLSSSYPVVERSASGLNQDQCPIMPAPTNSASFDMPPGTQADKVKRSTPRRRSSTGSKRSRDASAVSEDEEEKQRRRQDRNAREQQRSHRITEQIDHLKTVLGAANIPFKPDKFSTLVTVSDYIKQLQAKSAMLDAEHKKLIDTISRTNDIANSGSVPPSTECATAPTSPDQANSSDDKVTHFGPSVDYRGVFTRCGVPLAVLSIDGRFLDCNHEFERLTGHPREELLPLEALEKSSPAAVPPSGAAGVSPDPTTSQSKTRNLSLFNLLGRDSMEGAFMAMSEMLKHPAEDAPAGTQPRDYWTGVISLSRYGDKKTQMNISLVRSPEGRAKFFDCALTPITGTSG